VSYEVEIHQIKNNHAFFSECDRVCKLAHALYNRALFLNRQEFAKTGKFISGYSLIKQMKTEPTFKALPAGVAQAVVLQLHDNWKSFFATNKDYVVNPKKYKAKPKPPDYKRNGLSEALYTYQRISKTALRLGIINPSKTSIQLPYQHQGQKVKQVRIVPMNQYCFKIEVVYEAQPAKIVAGPNQVGIDIGLNNIVAVVGTNYKPEIVSGRPMKAINQWYNKELARLKQSRGEKKSKKQPPTKRMTQLTTKRNNRINDALHKISKGIVDRCLTQQVGSITIGYNEGWKQRLNFGKRGNQNFVQVPFGKLVERIKYKAEREGIKVEIREESYTSKCSWLDDEPLQKHPQYLGKRVKRGLFKSSAGFTINADINGAANILRKSNPQYNVFVEGIGAVLAPPVRRVF
jgi:putative transposase